MHSASMLQRDLRNLQPGDHACCLFEAEQQQRAVVAPFVRDGLEREEKVLYIGDASAPATVVSYLEAQGVPARAAEARGQLQIFTWDQTYLRDGFFDPDRMLSMLDRECEQAQSGGYRALRATSEMAWALRGLPGCDRLLEFEARVDGSAHRRLSVLLCQYDQRQFVPEVLLEVLRTHPLAVVGAEVYDNYYYLPSDQRLDGQAARAELIRWLQNLAARKQTEVLLRLREQRFRALFEQAGVGVAQIETETGRFMMVNQKYADIVGYSPSQMQRLTFQAITHPEDLAEDLANMQSLREGRQRGFTMEKRYHHKAGHDVWVNLTVSPLWEPGEKPSCHMAVVEDITGRKRAEASLRQSEADLSALFENAPVPMLIVDGERIVRRCNRAAAPLGAHGTVSMMGVAQGMALRCANHLNEDGGCGLGPDCCHCTLREAILHTFETGQSQVQVEARLVHAQEARVRLVLVSTVPFGPPSNRRVLVCLEDVTDRRAAEEALKASRESFANIVERTETGIIVADTNGIVRYANPVAAQLLNRPSGNLVGTRFQFPTVGGAALEVHVPDGAGGQRYLELETVATRWEGRRALLVSLRNITRQKRAELALRESRERLALTIDGSSDGIWDWNVVTNEVYYSPRWKSMLGYNQDELENHFTTWQQLLHPEERERALATVQAYLAGTSPKYELEHRLRHKDGGYRWILARGVALRDAAGKPTRMAGSHVDLTERKLAEERLQRANQDLAAREAELRRTLGVLEATNAELKATQLQLIQAEKLESVGKLAAGVAHEVKNPLQTMLMGLTYLQRRCVQADDDIKSAFADMRDAVERADSIVRGLLEMSGSPQLLLREENLNRIIERALELVNYHLNAARITSVRCLAPDLPSLRLDASKIEQVFINLFTNAIHAMPAGGELTVSTCTGNGAGAAPDGPWVVAEVQDTGTGVPADHLQMLFTPFFTTKPKGVGTGLGLRVCKSIVELHGGRIDLRNRPEGGVRVTVALKAGKEQHP